MTDRGEIVGAILDWYDDQARDLPWRRPGTSAWAVLISEVMLQQTPVSRVVGPWTAWITRWPTPADLAAEPSSAAVAAWGRMGYPRRALRLWQAARAITADHDGLVPDDPDVLRTLPGIGEYTAAAVAAFAYGRRTLVLDTNVRRVLARIDHGAALPPPHLSAAERVAAATWLPQDPATACHWNIAAMELGAVVCRAKDPSCDVCPVVAACAWVKAGKPPYEGLRRRQPWLGTDRQCRGVLLGALRERAYDEAELLALWPDPEQASRALQGLIDDGLAAQTGRVVRL